jgi:hypothetical protein
MTERKTSAVVVTEGAAHASLRGGPVRALAAEEERVLRMRLGASPPRGAVLERLATASDAEIEVLAYEIEAFLRLREAGRATPLPSPSATPPPAGGDLASSPRHWPREAWPVVPRGEREIPSVSPATSRTKEKILRALRRKA